MEGLLPGYKKCFFCGPATGGLSLELQYADETVFCEFTAHENFQGYDGMLHGGIVTGVLDEVMWWTLFVNTKTICATSKIEAEFKRPILCNNTYRASGKLLSSAHGVYNLSGSIKDTSGRLCARGKASFRKTKGFTMEGIMKHLDFRRVPPEIRLLFGTLEI
jgi:uncharacterized protein (TIGR00369 family)